MAHKNIDARRAWLTERLDQSRKLTVALTEEASALFGCSKTSICADWQRLNIERNRSHSLLSSGQTTLTPTIKEVVMVRDGNTCQYCEQDAGALPVLEHVVPVAWGGVTEPKNLVIACRSCNALKGRGVWIPHNFFAITACDPEWRRLAINLQRKGKEYNGRRKANQKTGA